MQLGVIMLMQLSDQLPMCMPFLILLSSVVGSDAFITQGDMNFASWIIVYMFSIMLTMLQELCKSC